MNNQRIKFNNKKYDQFVSELKNSVKSYFEEKGISEHANVAMVAKTIAMFAIYFGPYFVIMLLQPSPWVMLSLCVLMGLGIVGIGCAVQHDANHNAYSSREWVNKTLGYSLDAIGGNNYFWRIKHNILHHTYTNIHGKDEDISVSKFLRLAPNEPLKPIHRIQHWLAWPAYATLTLFWVFYFDFPKLKRYNGHGSPNPGVKHPVYEVVSLFIAKTLYFFYALVLPVLVLDIAWWQVLIGFLTMHFVAGLLLTTTFQLAHVVEHTDFPMPDEAGNIDNSWFVHQMETTSNFATHSHWLTWYIGGLNFQVEHHLFPKICSIHYPEINKIVMAKAAKYGVAYHEQPTLQAAIASHFRQLKEFSRQPTSKGKK